MYVNIEWIHCCAPGNGEDGSGNDDDDDDDDTSLDEYSNMYVIIYGI